MKKIDKIELKNVTVLNESEMRNVVGGNDGDPGFCPVFCNDGTIIEASTCIGASSMCGSAGFAFCSGTLERCF